MSIFSVKRNGTEIFAGRFLISPKLHLELNSAGYLEFDTTSGQAVYIEDIKTDTYTVYENNACIFAGRPTEITTKYNNKLHYYVEGAYGYFNDTVVAPLVYQSSIQYDKYGGAQMSAKQALQYIVNQHNSQVEANRQISISTKTKDVTGTVYRVFNFDKTMQCLSDLRDELGGLMYIEYVNEKPSLVWVSDLETDTSQVVKLGKNILDLSRKIQCADLPSAVLPVGPTIQSTDNVEEVDDLHILNADATHQYLVGQNLTLTNRTDVNNGSNIVKNVLYKDIGYQVEKVDFNDATSAQNLLYLCNEYLTRKVLQTMFINIDVADLHYASGYNTEGIIHFATNLQVIADKYTPAIDTKLPVSSMDVELDNAIKKISIGTLQKNDLSSKIKKNTDASDTNTKDIADNTNNLDDLQNKVDDNTSDIDNLRNKDVTVYSIVNPQTDADAVNIADVNVTGEDGAVTNYHIYQKPGGGSGDGDPVLYTLKGQNIDLATIPAIGTEGALLYVGKDGLRAYVNTLETGDINFVGLRGYKHRQYNNIIVPVWLDCKTEDTAESFNADGFLNVSAEFVPDASGQAGTWKTWCHAFLGGTTEAGNASVELGNQWIKSKANFNIVVTQSGKSYWHNGFGWNADVTIVT